MTTFDDAVKAMQDECDLHGGEVVVDARKIMSEALRAALPIIAQALREESETKVSTAYKNPIIGSFRQAFKDAADFVEEIA